MTVCLLEGYESLVGRARSGGSVAENGRVRSGAMGDLEGNALGVSLTHRRTALGVISGVPIRSEGEKNSYTY